MLHWLVPATVHNREAATQVVKSFLPLFRFIPYSLQFQSQPADAPVLVCLRPSRTCNEPGTSREHIFRNKIWSAAFLDTRMWNKINVAVPKYYTGTNCFPQGYADNTTTAMGCRIELTDSLASSCSSHSNWQTSMLAFTCLRCSPLAAAKFPAMYFVVRHWGSQGSRRGRDQLHLHQLAI